MLIVGGFDETGCLTETQDDDIISRDFGCGALVCVDRGVCWSS
jgi:hypothetical protein